MDTLASFVWSALSEERPRAFAERLGAPEWTYTSSTRMRERIRAIAGAIAAAGIAPGERVALVAENRVDWLAADFGILAAGCVVVPVFASLALDQLEYVFEDSEAKLAFVESRADAERIRRACPSAPRCIVFDGGGPDSLAEFEASGATVDDAAFEARTAGTDANAMALLIYTSGTTGEPKGVMLSHANVLFNTVTGSKLFPQRVRDARGPILAVLPLAHIYEHSDVLAVVYARCDLRVTRPDVLLDDLRSVRPLALALVPRIFERVLSGVRDKANEAGGFRAWLVPRALESARRHAAARAAGKTPGPVLGFAHALARKLVFEKLKTMLGLDRLVIFWSGSAPLHSDVALTFAGMDLPISEGYGLTETSPIVSANPPDAIRYGTVGKPLEGVEVRLGSDGEIQVKGPNVMLGYYRSAAQPFTEDGWFETGDVGAFDAKGYLTITDRKKELIKTSAGKYIAPGRVEAALRRSAYVGQCFVIGDGRPFPLALVCPNWTLVRREFDLTDDVSTEALAQRGDVRALLEGEAGAKTADLATFEQVRRVALLPSELTIEAGELSPTLKIKRRVVEKKFAAIIDAAYANVKR